MGLGIGLDGDAEVSGLPINTLDRRREQQCDVAIRCQFFDFAVDPNVAKVFIGRPIREMTMEFCCKASKSRFFLDQLYTVVCTRSLWFSMSCSSLRLDNRI